MRCIALKAHPAAPHHPRPYGSPGLLPDFPTEGDAYYLPKYECRLASDNECLATDERGTSLSTFPIFQSTFSWYPISLRDGSYSGKQSAKLIYTTFRQFVQVVEKVLPLTDE